MLNREQFLNKICNGTWSEVPGFGIIVKGDVYINNINITRIPFNFYSVSGNFYVYDNLLTSLKGCPEYVGVSFDCRNNFLTDLQYGPKHVGAVYDCSFNKLTSLKGSPHTIRTWFNCANNNLINLKDGPEIVYDTYDCAFNNLTSLIGSPKYIGYYLKCDNNRFDILYGLNYINSNECINYDNVCDFNKNILKYVKMHKILSANDIAKLIYEYKEFELLKNADEDIRKFFPTFILENVDNNIL